MDADSIVQEKPGSGVSDSLGKSPVREFRIVSGKARLGKFGESREKPGRYEYTSGIARTSVRM